MQKNKRKKAFWGAIISGIVGSAINAGTSAAGISAQEENLNKQLGFQRDMINYQRSMDMINNLNQQLGQGQDIYKDLRLTRRCGGKVRTKREVGGLTTLAANLNPTVSIIPTLTAPVQGVTVNTPPADINTAVNNIQSPETNYSMPIFEWTPDDTAALIGGVGSITGNIMKSIALRRQGEYETELQKQKAIAQKNIYNDRFNNSRYKVSVNNTNAIRKLLFG